MVVQEKARERISQSGYSAMRRGRAPALSGWCAPGRIHSDQTTAGAPDGSGAVVLFGPQDRYAATFEQGSVAVYRFDDIGPDAKPLLRAKLKINVSAADPAGASAPYRIFVRDDKRRLWTVDFAPESDAAGVPELGRTPQLGRLAEDHGPIDRFVVLRRKIMVQTLSRDGGFDLAQVDRRSGRVRALRHLDLDPDLGALDAARHDILLGRRKGEARLVLTGDDASGGAVEIAEMEMDRVSSVAIVDGTHVVVARKGGFLQKTDMRTALPAQAARAVDPLARLCYVLRELLRRCGCDCTCDGDGSDGNPDAPDRPDDDEPCKDRQSAKLGFTAHRMHRIGQNIVAFDRSATRMALLDKQLNIKMERKLDRAGADVALGGVHSQNLLIQMPRKQQVEAWKVADFIAELKPRLPDELGILQPRPQRPATYWGRKTPRADLNPTLRVCIFPVIDGGQTYGDPDMSQLIDQVSANMFGVVQDYYDECSFSELDVDFAVFGEDIGGTRRPLMLPRPQASYFYDAYRPGGLTIVMPADFSDPVVLDGTESFVMRANPRAGSVKDYELPFAALWTSRDLGNFPVTLDFDGTETLEMTVETQTGDSHVLALSFPATTLSVDQGGDIAAFLSDLGDLVTNAVRAAEADIAGDPVLIQPVTFRRFRYSSDDGGFGFLIGQFRIADAGAAATRKGRIDITVGPVGISAAARIGLTTAARTGVIDSSTQARNYLRFALQVAQAQAGEGIDASTAYFDTSVSNRIDTTADTLTIEISLAEATGGAGASIERISSTGLAGTGFDTALPNVASDSDTDNTDTLRDSVDLTHDTFTAALAHLRATTTWDSTAAEAMFNDFDVMMIAHVGAPPFALSAADRWNCDDPADFSDKRMYKRTVTATDQTPPGDETPVQMGTNAVTGQRFNAFSSTSMTVQAGVMAHELGHAIGLPDLYSESGHRDDVDYIDPWSMMGGENSTFHHFCGWAKWSLGWIPDDPDPAINRTIFVDLPSASETAVTEAWLVPVEWWDDGMAQDVRDEVGGSLPIGQLMKLNLGSDGGVTAFLELRAPGARFSQNLSPVPSVIASNGLDPASDTYWAVNGLYRRSVHQLNRGTELRAVNDRWDFATAPEFPIKGCVAEVADVRTVRGTIPIFRVRVEREQAEFIDLHFQDHVPSYKSPDIWVDWPGDNMNSAVPRLYPEGMPVDQGEPVRYPMSGVERHFVVARVHNAGNVEAQDVRVRWFVCDPPGAGDNGRWEVRGTQTIPQVGAGLSEITAFDWNVDSGTNVHQCMRMEIIDWTIPDGIDPDTGDTVALASDDVKLQNNNAQQNVFEFEALTSSPYPPIEFPMQVHNDRVGPEIATLVPTGLPYGSKLTVTPVEQEIPSGEARVFSCRLEMEEAIIRPGCDNDSGFLLTAWRRGHEADEIWGSCFYHIRPRYRTKIQLVRGHWFNGQARIYGRFDVVSDMPLDLAQDQPLVARLRLDTDAPGQAVEWRTVQIQPDGSFILDAQVDGAKGMIVQAWFDRTDRLGSSVSNEWPLTHQGLQ